MLYIIISLMCLQWALCLIPLDQSTFALGARIVTCSRLLPAPAGGLLVPVTCLHPAQDTATVPPPQPAGSPLFQTT